jgi:hypothetical protein
MQSRRALTMLLGGRAAEQLVTTLNPAPPPRRRP